MRCKVFLNTKVQINNEKGYALSFHTVYAGNEESNKYFQSTPAGYIIIKTINENAAAKFEAGKEYYVDFSPA